MLGPGNTPELDHNIALNDQVFAAPVVPQETIQNISAQRPDYPINDSNLANLNLEVLLVTFLLLALPITIYLAYRYGKKMGKKESAPISHHNFELENARRRPSQESTSATSLHQLDHTSSKASSTSNSPSLNPILSQKGSLRYIGSNSPSIRSDRNKREPSVKTEDEKFEEMILSDHNNSAVSPTGKLVPIENQDKEKESFKILYQHSRSLKEGKKDLNDNIFEEKLQLHSQDDQITRQEVKVGISFEKNKGQFQKTETTEVRTIYEPNAQVPEKNARLIKENYQKAPIFNRLLSHSAGANLKKTKSVGLLALPREEFRQVDFAKSVSQAVVVRKDSQFSQVNDNKGNNITANLSTKEDLSKVIIDPKIANLIEKYDLPDETGKFHKIFKEVEWIGNGSFGEVYKVVHRLDGKLYAVKKVKLTLGRFEDLKRESKVFREVFTMTDLHHPNIVRYSTCWVEIESDKDVQETQQGKNGKSIGLTEGLDLGDISENEGSEPDDSQEREISKNSDLGFEWDLSERDKDKRKKSLQKVGKTKEIFKKHTEKKAPRIKRNTSRLRLKTLTKSFIEEEIDEMSRNSSLSRVDSTGEFPGCKLYLYIQMEYCPGQSLRNNLENPKRKVVREKVLEMFKKLLEGVHAMHSRGIIHRDLKPANIFLDANENIKIGDFGLALTDNFEEQLEGLGSKESAWKGRKLHSLKVGTPMYTSPEQESGGHYDQRTDIYSLGLIFCEMLVNFVTNHERYNLLGQLRTKEELPATFMKNFAAESEIILRMTSKSPEDRPTAEQLMIEVDKLLEAQRLQGSSGQKI
jgi:serine/threonine protein kinase